MIEVQAKLLKEALQEAAAVVASRNTVPILGNVLIEADKSRLTIRATDLDMEFDRHVTLEKGAKLSTTVPARIFAAIVAKLPAKSVATLELKDGKLLMRAEQAKFSLATLPVDDFPVMASGEWDSRFELEAFDLAKLIDMLRFAVSTEETRYYLNGIFFHPSTSSGGAGEEVPVLRAAAMDGHRLARYELPLPEGAETLPDVILPRKAVEIIGKLLDKVEGKVELAFSATKFRFEAGETALTGKLVDGTFPDYSRVIPTGNDKKLGIAAKLLKSALERVQVIATEKTRGVSVSLAKDMATLKVTSAEHGVATEEVAGDYEGEALTIGFNARYMLDILARIHGEMALVELSDAAGPTIFHDPDCAQALFVLMPMRV